MEQTMKSYLKIGKNLTADVVEILSQENVFLITDNIVASFYPDYCKLVAKKFVIEAGEQSKTMDTVSKICESMVQNSCNRKTVVVALGGGVVGDISGFVASIYMRGVAWINIPTTLLAQVDSSIGGKTGVNLLSYKNIIGAFHLAEKVLIDVAFLSTIGKKEFACGMGEIIKTALLDVDIYEYLTKIYKHGLKKDGKKLLEIVEKCAMFKNSVTIEDYREKGLRKILNVGHTIGHALEKSENYTRSHGMYVLWGIYYEMKLIKNEVEPLFYAEINQILDEFLANKIVFDPMEVAEMTCKDKKNIDDKISIMNVLKPGKIEERFYTVEQIAQVLGE